jgi:hypothetical protein
MKKRSRRIIQYLLAGSFLAVIAALVVSALINRTFPARSQIVDRLSPLAKAHLAEVIHLRQSLGDAVWPGWGQKDIPVVAYNEEYAFLVSYPDPPAGWVKMPQRVARGGRWVPVPDDAFEGQLYYRQYLPSRDITPENFTVKVGERWVAAIQTREYARIAFYNGFRKQIPAWLRAVFPYPLVWNLLMGETEDYICAVEHEAFHSLQGIMAPSRLEQGETAIRFEAGYPWDNSALNTAWQEEMDLLVQAARAPSDGRASELAQQFLAARDKRRESFAFNPDLVNCERQREWLEGLAKYAELSIGRLAGRTPGYQPVSALKADSDFKNYTTRERFWSYQFDEARRIMGRPGDTRFYYSGMAQAAVLDRLLPRWKERIFDEGVALEDMMREGARSSDSDTGNGGGSRPDPAHARNRDQRQRSRQGQAAAGCAGLACPASPAVLRDTRHFSD